MEKIHFSIILRWLWLLILATLVASVVTYWVSQQQTPTYEANVRLIVGPGLDSPNPDLNALRTSGQLMQTYAEMVTTQPVLQVVVDELGLDIPPSRLGGRISVKTNKETQILSITVRDDDPRQAVAIANAAADMLLRLSPASSSSPEARLMDQMRSQAPKIEANIATSEEIIRQLEVEFQAATDVTQQRLIMDQLSTERNRLSEAHRTLALLYESLQQASINQIKIVEPAQGAAPIASQLQLRVLIGAGAGLVLGLLIVVAFEYFDETIKTPEELTETAGVSLLSVIAKHKTLHGVGRERLVVEALPKSQAAENYRMLGTKLLSKYRMNQIYGNHVSAETQETVGVEQPGAKDDQPARSVLVSSSQSGDTSEITANLAVVLAQTGQKVILVDACLHRPVIGQMFGVVDQRGLTGALADRSKTPDLIAVNWVPGLFILPSGPIPSNPFQLLASTRMVNLIEELENQADIVIVAASPLLSFADSLILASRVDGVVVVARKGKTRRDMVTDVVKSLRTLDARIIGTVFDYNRSSHLSFLSRGMVAPTLTTESVEPVKRVVAS